LLGVSSKRIIIFTFCMFSIANVIIQNGQNTGLIVGDFHKLIKTFKHGNSKKEIQTKSCLKQFALTLDFSRTLLAKIDKTHVNNGKVIYFSYGVTYMLSEKSHK